MIDKIQCGRRHCVATFDYGAFLFWGDNQVGQLGNRKRSFVESPYPNKKFEYRHNVENVILGVDSCGVIVEDTGRVKKKNPNKKKKILKQSEIASSEEELQRKTEAMVIKQSESHDGRGRKSLGLRIKEKFQNAVYGTKSESKEQKPNTPSPSKELEKLIEEEKKAKTKS